MPAPHLPARLYGRGLVGFFVGAMVLSLILTSFTAGRSDVQENRRLAPVPAWPRTSADWTAWPARFDAFVNDNFGLRAALLRLNARLSLVLKKKLLTQNVIEGLDGWLFFAGYNSLELYRNERPLGVNELSDWREALTRRRDWLAARNIPYLFAVAPDKHTIYPEFMPAYFWRRDRPSQYDQIVAMAREAGLPVLDMRPPLLAAKADGLVYLKHDTHWNQRGAYIGYRQIITALKSLPGLKPFELKLSDMPMVDMGVGDLARMAGLNWTEEAPDFDPAKGCRFETTIDPAPSSDTMFDTRHVTCPGLTYKALLFRDSFAARMISYIGQTFGTSTLVWKEPTFEEFKATVEAEKPDVVIEERAERYLQDVPEHLSN